MKKISPLVYENLTPQQRVVAYVEALARGDEKERRRLIRTCLKEAYIQPDLRFSDSIENLLGLAMAVQCDLQECILCWFLAIQVDPKKSKIHLQSFSNIQEAWNITITSLGIDKDSMVLAGPPPSLIFEMIEDLLPKPKFKKSKAMAEEMLKLWGK